MIKGAIDRNCLRRYASAPSRIAFQTSCIFSVPLSSRRIWERRNTAYNKPTIAMPNTDQIAIVSNGLNPIAYIAGYFLLKMNWTENVPRWLAVQDNPDFGSALDC